MTTDVMTLSEYAEMLEDLANQWEDDEPIVLIGDRNGSVQISDKDGYAQHGTVGYASELFASNGVNALSKGDTRFYGTMLMHPENLDEETVGKVFDTDWSDGEGQEVEG